MIDQKEKILRELKSIYPVDLSITEIASRADMSRPTASTWLKVLEAEKKVETSRVVGNAIFFRWKK